jgi:type II secretory pathway component PulJ
MKPRPSSPRPAGAFTLMEVILALATSAVLLAAVGGAFFSALRLRNRTAAAVDESLPLFRVLEVMKRDLKGALPPGGVMTGNFTYGSLQSGTALSQGTGLEFYTTTGAIREREPWGDVQQVIYQLRPASRRDDRGGQELVRAVGRNLLSTMGVVSEDEVILSNVERFEVECFDGYQWQTAWDTSLSETNLPVAVRVRLQQTPDPGMNSRDFEPFEIVVPLAIQVRTADTGTNAMQEAGQ